MDRQLLPRANWRSVPRHVATGHGHFPQTHYRVDRGGTCACGKPEGRHDADGSGAGGSAFPRETVERKGQGGLWHGQQDRAHRGIAGEATTAWGHRDWTVGAKPQKKDATRGGVEREQRWRHEPEQRRKREERRDKTGTTGEGRTDTRLVRDGARTF